MHNKGNPETTACKSAVCLSYGMDRCGAVAVAR